MKKITEADLIDYKEYIDPYGIDGITLDQAIADFCREIGAVGLIKIGDEYEVVFATEEEIKEVA